MLEDLTRSGCVPRYVSSRQSPAAVTGFAAASPPLNRSLGAARCSYCRRSSEKGLSHLPAGKRRLLEVFVLK